MATEAAKRRNCYKDAHSNASPVMDRIRSKCLDREKELLFVALKQFNKGLALTYDSDGIGC